MEDIKSKMKELMLIFYKFNILDIELDNKDTIYDSSNIEHNNLILSLYNKCVELENYKFEDLTDNYYFDSAYSSALFAYAQLLSYPIIKANSKGALFNKDNINLFSTEKIDKIISLYDKCIDYAVKTIEYKDEDVNIEKSLFRKMIVENDMFKVRVLYYYAIFLLFIGRVKESINYFLYASYPFENGMIGNAPSCEYLIEIFTNDDYLDIDRAMYLYNKLMELKETRIIDNDIPIEAIQVNAFCTMMNYFMRTGYYENAVKLYNEFLTKKISLYTENVLLNNENNDYQKFLDYVKNIVNSYKLKLDEINESNVTEDKYLVDDFDKDILAKMSGDIKVFITTSIRTFDFLNKENSDKNNLDFSAAIIPMMKALEILLEKLFVNNYFEFLKKEKDLNLEYINEFLKFKDGRTNKYLLKNSIERFTCGNALNMAMDKIWIDKSRLKSSANLEKNFLYSPNYYFCKYCKSVGIKDVENYVQDFGNDLEKILELRNNTAHKNRILPTDAKDAFDILIKTKKFINNLYKDFGFCF